MPKDVNFRCGVGDRSLQGFRLFAQIRVLESTLMGYYIPCATSNHNTSNDQLRGGSNHFFLPRVTATGFRVGCGVLRLRLAFLTWWKTIYRARGKPKSHGGQHKARPWWALRKPGET